MSNEEQMSTEKMCINTLMILRFLLEIRYLDFNLYHKPHCLFDNNSVSKHTVYDFFQQFTLFYFFLRTVRAMHVRLYWCVRGSCDFHRNIKVLNIKCNLTFLRTFLDRIFKYFYIPFSQKKKNTCFQSKRSEYQTEKNFQVEFRATLLAKL